MTITTENLNAVESEKFRRWIEDLNFEQLVRQVDVIAFQHECEAANKFIIGTSAADAEAAEQIKLAKQARHAAQILKKIRETKSLKVCKSTPTPTPIK